MSQIHVQNLSRSFVSYSGRNIINRIFRPTIERFDAVKQISFDIAEGECIGFIGPNGAGKTTTLKMLSGLLYPSHGHVTVLGHTPHMRDHDFLRKISLIMGQKSQLIWDMPVIASLELRKTLYDVSDSQYSRRVGELSDLLKTHDILTKQVRTLSLGERMKCEIIAALIHEPRILFLDEPTIGLDIVMQAQLRDFIAQYNLQHQATVILTSHYMEDVKKLCKRVIVINHGSIIYDGLLAKLTHTYTQHKYITVTYAKLVTHPTSLPYRGTIHAHTENQITVRVASGELPSEVAHLAKDPAVIDLSISEIPLEEIIAKLYTG